jgi:hypothetical protein
MTIENSPRATSAEPVRHRPGVYLETKEDENDGGKEVSERKQKAACLGDDFAGECDSNNECAHCGGAVEVARDARDQERDAQECEQKCFAGPSERDRAETVAEGVGDSDYRDHCGERPDDHHTGRHGCVAEEDT